ncbi:MAG: 50S ribosomal protein L15 [Candidatus Hydrogenedentota bacterium]
MKPRLTITDLAPARGSKFSKRRIGRGVGSGMGKTATKGHKGQKARSGWSMNVGFEGGQMPLIRRTPKSGFHSPFRVEYLPVNLGQLDKFENGAVIDPATLKTAGLSKGKMPVKILGKGQLTKKLTVKIHAVSDAAKKAILAAGGTVEEIAGNVPARS